MKKLNPDSSPASGMPEQILRFRGLFFLLVPLLVVSACSPRMAVFQPIGEFETSNATAGEVLPQLQLEFEQVDALTGRASTRISTPDYSELATLLFTSDRTRSFLAMRNNLGIEGGRIFADADSVTLYDRIEGRAWKMSSEDSHRILLNGLSAFNLLEFLLPAFSTEDVETVYETDVEWMMLLHTGNQLIFRKSDGLLQRIYQPSELPEAYNHFIFSNHANLEGLNLPRRIQILSNDEKSTIFLIIQALELNPSSPSFDIGIPDDIPINRI